MDAVPGKFYGVWSGLLYAWIVAGAVGSVMILEADLHGECFRQLDMAAGTVFHTFLGEKLPDWKAAAALVRKIAENYELPYYTLSPTYSICADHGS